MKVNELEMNKEFHLTELTLKENLKAQIYDNCLPLNIFEVMKEIMLSGEFPWFYNDTILYGGKFESPLDGYDNDNTVYQFTHSFFKPDDYIWSSWTEVILPILNVLPPRAWIRVKANLGTIQTKHLVGGWHCDMRDNTNKPYADCFNSILYMNTNNGYTLMETGDKIESIENRLVIFPSSVLHTGITQTDTKVRVLLNFNFF